MSAVCLFARPVGFWLLSIYTPKPLLRPCYICYARATNRVAIPHIPWIPPKYPYGQRQIDNPQRQVDGSSDKSMGKL